MHIAQPTVEQELYAIERALIQILLGKRVFGILVKGLLQYISHEKLSSEFDGPIVTPFKFACNY